MCERGCEWVRERGWSEKGCEYKIEGCEREGECIMCVCERERERGRVEKGRERGGVYNVCVCEREDVSG